MTKFRFLRHTTIVMSFFLLFQIGCAKPSDPEVVVVNPVKSVQLLFFSAPWCGECAPKIHEVREVLRRYDSQVKGTIYMVEGRQVHSKPTPEVAAEYSAKLSVPYTITIDPWHWTNYGKFYPGNNYAVPGLALEDAQGNVLKVYERGTFEALEVLGDVQAALK